MNKAVCLIMQDDVDDELDEYLRTSLKHVERDFDEKLAAFKENLLKSISRVEGALTFQPESDQKSLKSKSASLASLVERKHSASNVHQHMHSHGHDGHGESNTVASNEAREMLMSSDEGSAQQLMLGGGLENSVNDEVSVGEVTEASFSDTYSVVIVVEQIVNLLMPRSEVKNLVCRIDCDVSTHNLLASHAVEMIMDNDENSGSNDATQSSKGGFVAEKLPGLGCYTITFGSRHVPVDVAASLSGNQMRRLSSMSREEEELLIAETAQSNKRVVFHGKLGDNIDNCTMSMVLLTEPRDYKSSSMCKLVASVDVPIAVLLDAAEAKCKIDILLQQSHGLPLSNAVAILSVEVIGGEFAEFQ
jgi:hypothetical protein